MTTLICTEGHLYGHQTPQCPEFTDVYAGSNAINPKMQNFNTEIYAAWSETNADNRTQIRVKSYDGSSWSFVDGDNATKGINKDYTQNASYPQLVKVTEGNIVRSTNNGT